MHAIKQPSKGNSTPSSTLAACGTAISALKALIQPLPILDSWGEMDIIALEDAVYEVREHFLAAVLVAWAEGTPFWKIVS